MLSMFRELLPSEKIGKIFSFMSPNKWTYIGLVLAMLFPLVIIFYDLTIGALFVLLSGICDYIDGNVARYLKTSNKKGAYFDTMADRYGEYFIIYGLLLIEMSFLFFPYWVWIFMFMAGSLLTTYSKSSYFEKTGKELKGGFIERSERMLILFIGLLLGSVNIEYLLYVIIILSIATNLSAFERTLRGYFD